MTAIEWRPSLYRRGSGWLSAGVLGVYVGLVSGPTVAAAEPVLALESLVSEQINLLSPVTEQLDLESLASEQLNLKSRFIDEG